MSVVFLVILYCTQHANSCTPSSRDFEIFGNRRNRRRTGVGATVWHAFSYHDVVLGIVMTATLEHLHH